MDENQVTFTVKVSAKEPINDKVIREIIGDAGNAAYECAYTFGLTGILISTEHHESGWRKTP